MKMKIYGLENEIDFSNLINVLEIEDKALFKNILLELNNNINDIYSEDKQILLYENEEILKISKYMIINFDIFNIEFNSKNILTKLYNRLNDIIILDNKIDYGYTKLKTNIFNYINDKISDLSFEYEMSDDIKFKDLLKIVCLKFNTDNYNMPENKLMFLIDLINEFELAKILVLVNIKNYFKDDEIEELYKYAIYKEVNLLIVENYRQKKLLNNENKLYIDNDFDDFVTKI